MADLDFLKEPQFEEIIVDLEKLLSQANRSFLLGAGCSKCAGLPLTTELTDEVLNALEPSGKTKKILEFVKTNFTPGADITTIEDYLSEIVDNVAILERRKEKGIPICELDIGSEKVTLDELNHALNEIKFRIAQIILEKQIGLSTHQSFVNAIHKTLRGGKTIGRKPADYFILNYDTLIEDALSLEKINYTDGFKGGAIGWCDFKTYLAKDIEARIFKIHGSIDWCLSSNDILPKRFRGNHKDWYNLDKQVLIWPASTKYRETQNDPYAQLINFFHRSLT